MKRRTIAGWREDNEEEKCELMLTEVGCRRKKRSR
jgi:hypothetical protein